MALLPFPNLALFTLFLLSEIALLFAVPLLGSVSMPLALTVQACSVLLTTPTWSLMHEGIHGNLHPLPQWNKRLSRLLAVFYGAPFEGLRAGHLLHHRYSRTAEMTEVYDPAEQSRLRATLGHYLTILGGLYWAEVATGLLVWLPRSIRRRLRGRLGAHSELVRNFSDRIELPQALAQMRFDGACAGIVLGLAIWLHGSAWPCLLAALAGRALLISFHDNAYHYATELGRPELARNHRFPSGASWLVLHFNLHGVHHLFPNLPWRQLPARAAELGAVCDGGFFSAPLAQLRGPIPRFALPQAAPRSPR